jgi:hypothetical protein
MNNEMFCHSCGGRCVKTDETIKMKGELGFSIPVQVYECEDCKAKHIICPECSGNKFKINYHSGSIFEEVHDCPECMGMGTILIKNE